jgi:hypothetical protein
MHLVQILVPVYDNAGQPFERELFDVMRARLMERFGGMTAFVQSPALGLWKDQHSGATTRDDMILIEVMVQRFEPEWWAAYRRELEQAFRQDEIVVRVLGCERV